MTTMESKSLIGLVNWIQRAKGMADFSMVASSPSVVTPGLRRCPYIGWCLSIVIISL